MILTLYLMSAGDGQYGAASCPVDAPTDSNPNCFMDRRDTTGPTFSVRASRVYVDGSQTTATGRRRLRRRGVRDRRTGYVPGSPAYPTTGEELINSLGDPEIPVDPHGHIVPFRRPSTEPEATPSSRNRRSRTNSIPPSRHDAWRRRSECSGHSGRCYRSERSIRRSCTRCNERSISERTPNMSN